MRVLQHPDPTPEQLTIICISPAGTILIRGAAGSGKTTTALLRLKYLTEYWQIQRAADPFADEVRVLVLTFNRTLRGYINALAEEQVEANVQVEVRTFAKWAMELLNRPRVLETDTMIRELGVRARIPLKADFLVNEVQYALGRFMPDTLSEYLETVREGRGNSPRVDRALRIRLLNEVIEPYHRWKTEQQLWDWNDLAVELAQRKYAEYDVVIVDEAQDFTANQIRAIRNHLAEDHSLTLVLDAAQRIYATAFRWAEVGISLTTHDRFTLEVNHRNTIEIAQFALPLLQGLDLTSDGTMPNFESSNRHGDKPRVLRGLYSRQVDYTLDLIRRDIDLDRESVAFLHPKGWFDYLRTRLDRARLPYVTITQSQEWPEGDENIALSTMHSAKGLEFDHVFVLGLNQEVTQHGEEEGDAELENLRRLFAMAVGRARKSFTLGFKPDEASSLIELLDPDTFTAIDV